MLARLGYACALPWSSRGRRSCLHGASVSAVSTRSWCCWSRHLLGNTDLLIDPLEKVDRDIIPCRPDRAPGSWGEYAC